MIVYFCFYWFHWQVRGHVPRYGPCPFSVSGLFLQLEWDGGTSGVLLSSSWSARLQEFTLGVTFPPVVACVQPVVTGKRHGDVPHDGGHRHLLCVGSFDGKDYFSMSWL